jgi:hypothetical protein
MRHPTLPKLAAFFLLPVLLAAGALHLMSDDSPSNAQACTAEAARHQEYEPLIGNNGLYAIPQMLGKREPSLYDSAYGLLTLHSLRQHVEVPVSRAQIRALSAATGVTSRVWSRWYLYAIQQTSGKLVLDTSDSAVVAGTLTSAGYADERPPGTAHASYVELVSTTAAALDVLLATRGTAYVHGLEPTKRWIVAMVGHDPGHPYVDWQSARVMTALGLPIPEDLITRAQAWMTNQLSGRKELSYSAAAHDIFGYVSLMRAAGRSVPDDVYRYFRPLLQRFTKGTDLQLAYYVAESWTAKDDPLLQAQKTAVTSLHLLSGLVAENAQLIGSIDATYYVEAIRAAKGESTCEPPVARALEDLVSAQWNSFDPVTKGMWVVAVKLANGDVDDGRRRGALQAMLGDLPGTLQPGNVRRWALEADLVTKMGGKVPTSTTSGWAVTDRLSLQASSTLVLAMAELHTSPRALAQVRANDLRSALRSARLAPTTYEYFDALRAYVALGGSLTPDLVQQAGEEAFAVSRCKVASGLALTAPRLEECDLRATLSLTRARQEISRLASESRGSN